MDIDTKLAHTQSTLRSQQNLLIAKLLDRLLRKCIHKPCHILETPCWHWLGAVCNKEYAHFAWWDGVKKKRFWKRGHIWLWELVTGRPVRSGYTLDHRCLNTRCVRPDHLEEITRAKNTARGNRTRHGHAAEANTKAGMPEFT